MSQQNRVESPSASRAARAEGAPPLRVLHVTPYFAPASRYGGLVEAVFHYARELARLGVAVQVLTTDANGPSERLTRGERIAYEHADGIEVHYCRRAAPQAIAPELVARLPALVRASDLVHLHAAYSFPVIPTLAIARVLAKPLVWTPHGALQRWSGSRRPRLKTAWEVACRALAPPRLVLHVTSEEEARESAGRLGEVSMTLIPNGVAIPDALRRTPRDGRLRLGFIGRLDPKKGIENLLAAYRIIGGRGRIACSLAIAGAGAPEYEQALRRAAAAMPPGAEVTMLGDVRGEHKRRLFENTDIIVVPSYTENFGLVVAESLAHGVPVIAGTGTPWSEVEKAGCGLWVDNTPEALAGAIEKMHAMPLSEMGRRGRQWMMSRFTWNRCAAELLECYADLVSTYASVRTRSQPHTRGSA
jgi:glycosyltransferase involved in cell wall biosynthesis